MKTLNANVSMQPTARMYRAQLTALYVPFRSSDSQHLQLDYAQGNYNDPARSLFSTI